MKFALEKMMSKLPRPANEKWPEGVWDVQAFARHGLSLELFTPRGKDYQTPHDQDELYLVVKGSGELRIGEKLHPFEAGDVFFVAAGEDHRFETFSDDFASWVIFWGPKLGEEG